MREKSDYSAEIGNKTLKSVNHEDNIAVLEQDSRMFFESFWKPCAATTALVEDLKYFLSLQLKSEKIIKNNAAVKSVSLPTRLVWINGK